MADEERVDLTPEGEKRFSHKVLVLIILALIALAGGAAYYSGVFRAREAAVAKEAKGEKYTCGMHPWIISDKPGDCPICQMKFTKIEDVPPAPVAPAAAKPKEDDFFADVGGSKTSRPKGERKLLFYRNPMNPMATSPKPAKDEMGMDYVPVYSDEVEAMSSKGVEGLSTVRVGEEALKLTGVQTSQAVREKVSRTMRTVGLVVPDETRVRRVQTKVEGWVEKLYVNFTGQLVSKGQPLLSIYSPELLASQGEYLKARETAARFAASPDKDTRQLGQELEESARKRLELFDVPKGFLDELDKSGKALRSVTLNAPVAGYVTAKGVFEGQKVDPGTELLTLTDLARVWVEADVYEYEAGAVRLGQEAVISASGAPSSFRGKVTFISPVLAPESRTIKVRFELDNPKLELKPQMFADVTLALESADGVTIPDSAVMDTGVRRVVFVETAPGTFEPREVTLGVRGEGKAQILAGVREGEKVVVKANFLIDSESRLRAALSKMSQGSSK